MKKIYINHTSHLKGFQLLASFANSISSIFDRVLNLLLSVLHSQKLAFKVIRTTGFLVKDQIHC